MQQQADTEVKPSPATFTGIGTVVEKSQARVTWDLGIPVSSFWLGEEENQAGSNRNRNSLYSLLFLAE